MIHKYVRQISKTLDNLKKKETAMLISACSTVNPGEISRQRKLPWVTETSKSASIPEPTSSVTQHQGQRQLSAKRKSDPKTISVKRRLGEYKDLHNKNILTMMYEQLWCVPCGRGLSLKSDTIQGHLSSEGHITKVAEMERDIPRRGQ